jgi:hypothetical protein
LVSFALSPLCCVLSGETTHTNVIAFGLTRPRLEPTIYHTRGKRTDHDATFFFLRLYCVKIELMCNLMIASLCQVNLTELKVHDIVKIELMCNLMIASLCQVNLTELKVHDCIVCFSSTWGRRNQTIKIIT